MAKGARRCVSVCVGVAVQCTSGWRRLFLVEQSAKQDRRAWTSRSRSEAQVKRPLPDGFLIPLLFSRSSAICDVKKPNLIIRSWQMSALAQGCLFPGYVHITATQVLLKTVKNQSGLCCTWSLIISSFWFVWKAGKLDGNSVLIPRCCLTVCSRTLGNKSSPKHHFHTHSIELLAWQIRAHVSI